MSNKRKVKQKRWGEAERESGRVERERERNNMQKQFNCVANNKGKLALFAIRIVVVNVNFADGEQVHK